MKHKPLFAVIASLDGYITAYTAHNPRLGTKSTIAIQEWADKCSELKSWNEAGIPIFDLRNTPEPLVKIGSSLLYQYDCYHYWTSDLIKALRHNGIVEYKPQEA